MGANAQPTETTSPHLRDEPADLPATVAELEDAGATFGPIHDERWGRVTVMTMPGGARLSIYEPSHPRPFREA